MDFKCYIENCTTPSSYYCKCIENFAFMCLNHIHQHLNENEREEHSLQVIYAKINPEQKALNLEKYAQMLESLKSKEISIHTELSTLINNLNSLQTEYIKYFREQRLNFQQIIERLEKGDKEIIVPGHETQNFGFDYYNFYLDDLNSGIKSYCEKATQDFANINKKIKTHKEFFNNNDELDYKRNANLDKHLYCFQTGTKNFIEFNTLTLNKRTIQIDVNESQGIMASICQIPGKKIFYSGSYTPNLDVTYLIDLQTFAVEQLQKIRVRGWTTATYFNNHVYIFGGHTGSIQLNNAEKFDLANKKWVTLGPLPNVVHEIHVLPFRTYFLMTFFTNSSLLKYGIYENSYEALGRNPGQCSSLIRDKEKIYLISSNILYLSKEENLSVWTQVKSLSQSLFNHTSKPVTRKREVFLLSSYQNRIWKFNLDSLDLILIGSAW